ncbi:hypothetical protein [Sinosporangium album]|nr:hypothetical protein [Sinosporangium album]
MTAGRRHVLVVEDDHTIALAVRARLSADRRLGPAPLRPSTRG